MKTHFHPLCVIWAHRGVITKSPQDQNFFLVIENVDPKVLYSASRPRMFRSFMRIEKFMHLWAKNREAFGKKPPEIGFVYSDMRKGTDGIAHAIPLHLSDPSQDAKEQWKFKLHFPNQQLKEGLYSEIALFIDWLPSTQCPGPIKIIFPNMN